MFLVYVHDDHGVLIFNRLKIHIPNKVVLEMKHSKRAFESYLSYFYWMYTFAQVKIES